ncbi:CBU_0592 family membrane protein [Lewinella cohaerens]|uniref:CBU_0592 family membrane protein n=1 Tax=Lewinella cohaerens TaxID=70995 RepID=UPI00035CA772
MNTTDLLGFAGVALILIAYFLNLNQRLAANDLRYILMNLVGAILACLASVLMKYYPFVLLEGTWAIVSLVALVKKLKDATKT